MPKNLADLRRLRAVINVQLGKSKCRVGWKITGNLEGFSKVGVR